MNLVFKKVFGETRPTLPLSDSGNIICGNSTRMAWDAVCPKESDAEVYILGNPPYLGARKQDRAHKSDMDVVFEKIKSYGNLDYIACWFLLGSQYIKNSNARLAFVSTNSISQGEQVSLLWPNIFKIGCEIGFAHRSFKWTNNAKGNAGVTCVIIGLRNQSSKPKALYKGGFAHIVKNINPYITEGGDTVVGRRTKALSAFPGMHFGNMPNDGGNLILSTLEKNQLIEKHPNAQKFIKKLIGSREFIQGIERWCIWISDDMLSLALTIEPINSRIEAVKKMRLQSRKVATKKSASTPHRFAEIRYKEANSIIIPRVSSERRKYIPIGFLDDAVISDRAFAIYDPPLHMFAIISSRIHMTWVRAVAGRMKTDYSYASTLCYNTFPFPAISNDQKTMLEDHIFNLLDEREKHSEKTMAELYDPDKMPEGLRQAHHDMDMAVERCYRSKPFASDEERLEYLFKLYEAMITAEKST